MAQIRAFTAGVPGCTTCLVISALAEGKVPVAFDSYQDSRLKVFVFMRLVDTMPESLTGMVSGDATLVSKL